MYKFAESLDISWQQLDDDKFYREISKYPNLKSLICDANKITNLDYLPASLQYLHCHNNQITHLDHLPANLLLLGCSNNKITSLDHLPTSLRILDCRHNKITSLDYLPNTLLELNCSWNQITSLDYLPTRLYKLESWFNKTTSLNYLPSSLKDLSCQLMKIFPLLFYDNLSIKRSKYLRFLRNQQNTRKTVLYMVLRQLQNQSAFNGLCLPIEIIKHIISFV